MIQIGKEIRKILDKRKIPVTKLAKDIGITRNVAYDIFNRKSINTGLLLKISKALKHDFFKMYSDQLKKGK